MMILLFFLLVAELNLMILRFNNHAPFKNCLISSVVMMINCILLFCPNLPYLVYAVIVLLLFIHLAFAFFKERLREKNSLSPNSIREAVDNLQMGICFADPFGRIVLINKKMQELAGKLFGYCPQMLNEMTEALQAPKHGIFVSDNCIRTQNGVIYRFRLYEHTVDGQTGWKQITVYDIYNHGMKELIDVIYRTLNGEKIFPAFSPSVEMKKTFSQNFSPIQTDILRAFIRGDTYKDIADRYHLSVSGVRWHMAEMIRLGEFRNKAELINTAIENKLVVATLSDDDEDE